MRNENDPPILYGAEFSKAIDYETFRPEGRSDYLLIYTLEGEGLITHGSMEYCSEPGCLVWFEPGALQDYRTSKTVGFWRFLWLHFQAPPAIRALVDWPAWQQGVFVFRVADPRRRVEIEEAFHRILRYVDYHESHAPALPFLALEEMIRLAKLTDQEASRCADSRIRQALGFIRENYQKPFNLEEVARRVGLSRSRFSALFRKQMGQTPLEYHERQRMNHASSLLQLTQLSVSEVAHTCGFEDALYFSKRFRRWFGRAPSAQRPK